MRVTIRQLRRFVQEALDVDDDMNRIAEPVGEKLGNDDPDLQVEISLAELRQLVREALGAYVTDYKSSAAKGGLTTGPWPDLGDNARTDDYDDRREDSEEDWPGPTGGSPQKTNRDKLNNEVQSLGRRTGRPTMRLGTSIADEDEDGFLEETIEFGYQTYPRFMNYNDEMIIGPEERKEREQTWQQALDLFQMYGKEMGAKTPSDPGFIEFARNELAKDGTSDDAISVTLGRLENSNGG